MSADRCSWLDEMAPELALGLLDGADRAAALAHLERCARCQAEVAALTAAGEQLLLLAPEVPPPAGFETRVLERIEPAPEDTHSPHPSGAARARFRRFRSYLPLGAAAAVILLAAVVVGGWLTSRGDGDAGPTTEMISARRSAVVGEARLMDGDPRVVEIDIEEWVEEVEERGAVPEGPWSLTVEDGDGGEASYAMHLRDSPARVTLADALPGSDTIDVDRVRRIAVVAGDGSEWCSGTFEDT